MAVGEGEQKPLLEDDGAPFLPAPSEPQTTAGLTGPLAHGRRAATQWLSGRWLPLSLLLGALTALLMFTLTADGDDESMVSISPEAAAGPDGREGGVVAAVGEVARAGASAGAQDPAGPVDSRRADARSQDELESTEPTGTGDAAAGAATTRSTSGRTTTTDTTRSDRTTTTADPRVTSSPSSTASTTTTTSPTKRTNSDPVTIGGDVVFASTGGGVRGITVRLLLDTDGDGSGDVVEGNATTGSKGRYSLTADPACYVVEIRVPSPQSVTQGRASRALCLDGGKSSKNNSIAITDPPFARPSSCEVQIGNDRFAGVEIWDSAAEWAPAYHFLASDGKILHTTTDFGPPDDVEPDEPSIEWTSEVNGFEESKVHAVAALHDQGIASSPVTCRRVSID